MDIKKKHIAALNALIREYERGRNSWEEHVDEEILLIKRNKNLSCAKELLAELRSEVDEKRQPIAIPIE